MKQYKDNNKELKEAITEVIAFFDKFDFPLTSFEVWRYLKVKVEYIDVVCLLTDEEIQGIGSMNGFYFKIGRVATVETRMRRYNYSNRKFKKALFFSRLFKYIPWIKMIAVGNIIGPNNMRGTGDIDFFIITEKSRIWMTRAFCVLIAKILRARPRLHKTKDTICLSFYISEDNLNLGELTYGKKDMYFLFWLACLSPVYDEGKYYENLIDENMWLLNQLPNWKRGIMSDSRRVKARKTVFYHDIIDMLIGGLEPWAKKKQLEIMPEVLARQINHPSKAVVINDKVLKLHVNDRRGEYNRQEIGIRN